MTAPAIILVLLSSPLLLAFLVSKAKGTELSIHKYSCWGLAIAFIFFSIGHFVKTAGMVEMLPSVIPFRTEMIYATGVLEFLVGIALFFRHFRLKAAWVAIVIFVLFFPPNIYSALNSVGLGGHQWGAAYLFIRAPLQAILIAWTYFLCINKGIISTSNRPCGSVRNSRSWAF